MRWATALSERPRADEAVAEAADGILSHPGLASPDLVVLFVSAHHAERYAEIAKRIGERVPGALVIGCSARSVIGGGHEVEDRPAVSLTAATLPGVALRAFHLDGESLPEVDAGSEAWRSILGIESEEAPHFLLLSDPFSFDVERILRGLDASFPGASKVGGVASGGQTPGDNGLYLRGRLHRAGMVGLALSGNVELDTVVAQGCRPIGQPMFLTRCRENWLLELDGRPALDVLREIYKGLPPADQELCRTSLFLGIEMRGAQSEYHHGDFLIRNLLGSDQENASIAVGALLKETSVVQFHLRDARTSAEDLERRLERYRGELAARAPRGALMFSCLGRGMHLYGRCGHDTELLRRSLGEIPVGGFFCNGEIGPVQGTTFLHGYTSAFALFRERDAS